MISYGMEILEKTHNIVQPSTAVELRVSGGNLPSVLEPIQRVVLRRHSLENNNASDNLLWLHSSSAGRSPAEGDRVTCRPDVENVEADGRLRLLGCNEGAARGEACAAERDASGGAAAVDQLDDAVGVVVEFRGEGEAGEADVEGRADQIFEGVGEVGGDGGRHAGCWRGELSCFQVCWGGSYAQGEEGRGGEEEATHVDGLEFGFVEVKDEWKRNECMLLCAVGVNEREKNQHEETGKRKGMGEHLLTQDICTALHHASGFGIMAATMHTITCVSPVLNPSRASRYCRRKGRSPGSNGPAPQIHSKY